MEHQRAWAHCRSPRSEQTANSAALLSPPADGSQQTNYSHHRKCTRVATFQLCGLYLPSLGTFSESMTPQAYFLLKIYTKTKCRATKYRLRSPEGRCCFCGCAGFVLSTHPMHQTKPSPGMIYPYRNFARWSFRTVAP